MPTLQVARSFLHKLLQREYTQDDFVDLCFQFGVELDEVTSEKEIFKREHATDLESESVKAKLATLSDEVLYKIDTAANRYDLLSAEGMAIALRVFTGAMSLPPLKVLPPKFTMSVRPAVKRVRDFIVCAILRDISFTPESYASFIDFQEKLHSGLARKRTLASVGTHDLDKVQPPFLYDAIPKANIQFVPLHQTRVLDCTGEGLAQYYKDDKHISRFVPLISEFPNYPVVMDSANHIMSLPPIINSSYSCIDVSTKNIFIECTAPDHHKAHVLVNQMVSAFSMYCKEPFTVEGVHVDYGCPVEELKGATQEITPDFGMREMTVKVDTVNARVGIQITADKCAELLRKMLISATVVDSNTVKASIPVSRSDVLHPCDLIEDVAIAYGYDNIHMVETPTRCSGYQTPMNKLSHLVRIELANAGYTEMLTLSLCSRDDAFKNLRRVDNDVAVHIENPQTQEFQVCRPSLLPGTLKTLQSNKSAALPIRLFEVTDVVLLDPTNRIGVRNERHVAGLHCAAGSASFEDMHGMAEFIIQKIGLPLRPFDKTTKAFFEEGGALNACFCVEEGNDPAFFAGRAMDIVLEEKAADGSIHRSKLGHVGVLHPEVLRAYDIVYPCSYLEFNLQPLLCFS